MKHLLVFLSFGLLLMAGACKTHQKTTSTTTKQPADTRTKVLIHTDLGDMKVVLYDETPQHRDNFIKLVKAGTINGTLFHRVIPEFMIQGGDVDSKTAKPGAMLGNGDVGYTIPAEFNPNLYHKKGALAAARQGDDVNPTKASSGCQFYIVEGKVWTDSTLNMFMAQQNQPIRQKIFMAIINKPENAALKAAFMRNQMAGRMDSLNILSTQIVPQIEAEFAKTPHRTLTDEQRKIYTTVGGAPHLDGGYTVFGEVYEGLDVIDKIAAVPRDANDRPKTDIHLTVSIIQ